MSATQRRGVAGLSPRLHIMKTSSGGKRELRKEGLGSGWAKGKDLLHIHQPIKKKKKESLISRQLCGSGLEVAKGWMVVYDT